MALHLPNLGSFTAPFPMMVNHPWKFRPQNDAVEGPKLPQSSSGAIRFISYRQLNEIVMTKMPNRRKEPVACNTPAESNGTVPFISAFTLKEVLYQSMIVTSCPRSLIPPNLLLG